jgi:hypothetical protein|tara:strand:- start:371 stop:472 length:102 start_codon:yes stop_codon:yes gene_type:complete
MMGVATRKINIDKTPQLWHTWCSADEKLVRLDF